MDTADMIGPAMGQAAVRANERELAGLMPQALDDLEREVAMTGEVISSLAGILQEVICADRMADLPVDPTVAKASNLLTRLDSIEGGIRHNRQRLEMLCGAVTL